MTALGEGGTQAPGDAVLVTGLLEKDKSVQRDLDATTSPLLLLPGEIRNRIYEYALTTDEELRLAPGCDGGKVQLNAESPGYYDHEFNQVKYACRQLYKETAGQEVKFNMVFLGSTEPSPHFLDFMATCSVSKLAWFTNVTLVLAYELTFTLFPIEPATALLPLADFCRQNPHVQIKYALEHFGNRFFDIQGFIDVGVRISICMRGIDPTGLIDELDDDDIDENYLEPDWASETERLRMDLPNLRFYPYSVSDELKDELREFDDSKLFLKLVEDWEKNGI